MNFDDLVNQNRVTKKNTDFQDDLQKLIRTSNKRNFQDQNHGHQDPFLEIYFKTTFMRIEIENNVVTRM